VSSEWHAYGTAARCIYHLRIAIGSLGELDTQLELAVRLKFVRESDMDGVRADLSRTRQLVHGLLRAKQVQLFKSAGKGLALLLVPTVGWLALTVLA
jgi:hypothetical protein